MRMQEHLIGKFTGHSIRVATVKGNDHGVIRVTILDSSDRQIYQKEIDTYASETRRWSRTDE